MKRKLFALLLSLCMVLTMMPSMGFAEAEEPLYAVWLKDDETLSGSTIAENQISMKFGGNGDNQEMDLQLGDEKAVQYFCYKNENNSYTVLDVKVGDNANIRGEGLTFRINEYDKYCCIKPADGASIDTTGTITITGSDNKEYSLSYKITMPYIGAYTSTNFDANSLVPGWELSYDALGEESDSGEGKTIYFYIRTGDGETVESMSLTNSNGNLVSGNFVSDSENKKNYLEVTVPGNVLDARFQVSASIKQNGSENTQSYTSPEFRITGNAIYCIRENLDAVLNDDNTIQPEYADKMISIAPGDEQSFFLGIPTGSNDSYTVVNNAVFESPNSGLSLEKRGNSEYVYTLKATSNEGLDTTYYLKAEAEGKTYKIPVQYELPYIGAYKGTTRTGDNYLGNSDIYNKVKSEGKFYIIVNGTEGNIDCTTPAGVTAGTTVTDNENRTRSIEITINDKEFQSGNISVQVDNYRWELGLSKDEGDDGNDEPSGNGLRCIWVNRDTNLKEGDRISTEYADSDMSIAPGEEQSFFLGIPTGDDEYEIVAADVSADFQSADTYEDSSINPGNDLSLERTGRRNQGYSLKATASAVLDTTYYLEAKVRSEDEDEVTYKIPVHYELPYIGVYKTSKRNGSGYLGDSDIYNKIKSEGKFYIIVNDTGKAISWGVPDGIEIKSVTAGTENTQCLEVTIDENEFEKGEISVKVGDNNPWRIRLSKNEGDDGEDEKVERTDYTVIPCTKEGADYIPIELDSVEEYNGIEAAAQFFVGDYEDRTFYVLTTKTGTLTLKELDYYREATDGDVENIEVKEVVGTYKFDDDGEPYTVWEVEVEKDFNGALRAGFAFNSVLATYNGKAVSEEDDGYFGPYTKFMWILDESYDEPNYNQSDTDRIHPCARKPEDGAVYSSMDDFVEQVGLIANNDNGSGTKYINLSKAMGDEDNAIYILHPVGTTLHDESAVESAYAVEGSGIGRGYHTGGYFRQILNGEIYNYTRDVGTVTIDGKGMTITKATLKDSYGAASGANFMDSVFYLTKDENGSTVKVEGYASVYLQRGMNVVMKGADENVATIDNDYNKVSNAVGYEDVAEKLSFEKQTDGTYNAFYREACANVSDEGTGVLTSFCVDLEPGYVVEKITDNKENQLGFTSERRFLYALLNEDGDPIYNAEEISDLGWHGGARSSADNDENRTLIDVGHCVAAYVPDYMEKLQHSELGETNIDNLVEFLTKEEITGAGYSVELRTAYTVYTVYFDPDNEETERNEIVFHIKKADIGNDIGATNNGTAFSIEAAIADMQNADRTQVEKFLKALDFDEFSLLNVYEMTAKDQATNRQGLYNITIPLSKLASGTALTDYKVVYFEEGDDGKVYPMEVETTYVEGKGIVFTTGHFSKYAVIYKPANTDGGNSGGGSSSGGYVAPTTDDVTNKTEDKTANTTATTTATVKNTTTTASDGTKKVTATVDAATADKIVEKAVKNKSAEVVVDAATKSAVTETAAGTKTEVTIPAATVSQVAEKTDAAVTIKSDAVEVTLDKEAVKAVAEAAGTAGEVKLEVETVAQDENKVQVDLKLVTSKGNVSDFKGGSVSVTVKLGAKLAAKEVKCLYIDDNKAYHKVNGAKNADGTFTFNTGHFSSYAVMTAEDADKAIAEQEAKAAKLTKALSLKARSAKTAKGYIKVTLTADEDAIKQIEDLGYTVKYKFYRSTKKAKGYKAKLEGTGKTYTNTTGKKGTKYYYKARVMVYDDEGTLVANSELKQCKYAARTK